MRTISELKRLAAILQSLDDDDYEYVVEAYCSLLEEPEYYRSEFISTKAPRIRQTKSGKYKIAGKNKPMWTSSSRETAKLYHANQRGHPGVPLSGKGPRSDTHQIEPKGKIAHHRDKKVRRLIDKHLGRYERRKKGDIYGDPDEKRSPPSYHQLLQTHRSKDIRKHPVTKLLKKHGYTGYTHPEDDHTAHKYNAGDGDIVRNKRGGQDDKSTVLFKAKHARVKGTAFKKHEVPEKTPTRKLRSGLTMPAKRPNLPEWFWPTR